jgi:hypothetical protein
VGILNRNPGTGYGYVKAELASKFYDLKLDIFLGGLRANPGA